MLRNSCVLCCTNWVGPIFSLAAMMTSVGCWLLLLSTVIWEWLAQSTRRLAGVDDDWLIFTVPLGMMIGMALWIAKRRFFWTHLVGIGSLVVLLASLAKQLTTDVPPGMENLGRAIGQMIAVAFAYVALYSGLASLVIACVTVLLLRLIPSKYPKAIHPSNSGA